MQPRWLVVFGPPRPEYNIEQDLKLDNEDARRYREYVYDHLKPSFLRGKKYAYIVKYQGSGYIIDDPNGSFWREVLREGMVRPRYMLRFEVYFEVRRMELVGGEFYCTDPYKKDFNEIIDNWRKKGLSALDPD